MAKKVTLYMADWCHWCHKVVDFFNANRIPFEPKDVDDPANAKECMEKSGQAGIPVIEVDGQIVVGFDEKKLKELLGL